MRTTAFIDRYGFKKDTSKPGRILETGKIGDVYITRLTVDPGVVTGNLYHKKTDVIFFVTKGKVRFKFEQVYTGEKKGLILGRTGGIIHLPAGVAIANRNISRGPAVIVFFSNRAFRSGDDYPFELIKTKE